MMQLTSPIHILWFVNGPLPDVLMHYGKDHKGSGGWISEELNLLRQNEGYQFSIVCMLPGQDEQMTIDGVNYYVVGTGSLFLNKLVNGYGERNVVFGKCYRLVQRLKPDLVHIHGTEVFSRLLLQYKIPCPVIVSLQGLLGPISEWYHWFGKLPLWQIITQDISLRFFQSGLLFNLVRSRRKAAEELRVLRKVKFVLGRTDWDRAHILMQNPLAHYFSAMRVIRKPFWGRTWELELAKKYRLVISSPRHPRKGADLVLDAVEKLQRIYPDIELLIIGGLGSGGYARNLQKRIEKIGTCVKLMGPQTAEGVAQIYRGAHVFVSASYIENSPNSVAEAQVVGMPVVSTFTGGVGSLVEHGKTGLLFPTGDVALLCDRIRTILDDDSLAQRLSDAAFSIARARHNPESIYDGINGAYKACLDRNESRP